HAHQHHGTAGAGARGLTAALAVTLAILVVQVAGALVGGSLALLADSGHLLTDVGSLALAVVAVRMASRPPSGRHTFCWQAAAVLAALANGCALLVIAALTVWAAAGRLSDPPDVAGGVQLPAPSGGLGGPGA